MSLKISRTILRTISLGAINMLLLVGCSAGVLGQNNSAATSEPKDSSAKTTPTSFVLPSGNIYCALVGESRGILRCEILSLLNPLPPQPDNCEFDWGAGLLLSQQGKAEVLCISDTIAGSNYTLIYGSTWTKAGFTCKSQRIGLICQNSRDRGFFLSREGWYLF